MGCHFLLQGIVPTQGSNLGFLHCRQILYRLSHQKISQLFKFWFLFNLSFNLSFSSRISIPGLGRSSRGGHGNPLQQGSWENSIERGAWQATYSPWGSKESDAIEHACMHKVSIFTFLLENLCSNNHCSFTVVSVSFVSHCNYLYWPLFKKNCIVGNSLTVQWLGLGAFTAVAQVQSLVRELRFPQVMRHSWEKKMHCNP